MRSLDEFGEKLHWIDQVMKETNKTIHDHNRAAQKEEKRRIKREMNKQEQIGRKSKA